MNNKNTKTVNTTSLLNNKVVKSSLLSFSGLVFYFAHIMQQAQASSDAMSMQAMSDKNSDAQNDNESSLLDQHVALKDETESDEQLSENSDATVLAELDDTLLEDGSQLTDDFLGSEYIIPVSDASSGSVAAQSSEASEGGSSTPWILGGLALVGGGIALAASDSDDSSSSSTVAASPSDDTPEVTHTYGVLSTAELNVIDATTSDVITATISDGNLDVLGTLTNLHGNNALTIALTDASASARQLIDLSEKTSKDINGLSIKDIDSSSAEDVKTMVSLQNKLGLSDTWNVKLSDANLNAADVKIINSGTTQTSSIDNNTSNTKVIDGGTSGEIDISAATSITGTVEDLLDIVNNVGASFETSGDYGVTCTNDASPQAISAILGHTTGPVTASVDASGSLGSLISELSGASPQDVLSFVLGTNTASVQELMQLSSLTSGPIDASSITNVTGSTADIADLTSLSSLSNFSLGDSVAVSVSDAVSIGQLSEYMALSSASGVGVNFEGGIRDSAAAFAAADGVGTEGLAAIVENHPNVGISITDTATMAQLEAIKSGLSGSVVLEQGLTDVASVFATADGTMGEYWGTIAADYPDVAISITGPSSVAQFQAIDAASTADIQSNGGISDVATAFAAADGTTVVSWAATTFTYPDLAISISDQSSVAQFRAVDRQSTLDIASNGGISDVAASFAAADGTSTEGSSAIAAKYTDLGISITDQANMLQFNSIDAASSENVGLSAGLKDTADNLALGGNPVSGFIAATSQNDDLEVEVTDTGTVSELNKIAELAGGSITATISGDKATLSNLTTAATDKITMTVTDDISVADFIGLDAHTSLSISLNGAVSDSALNFAATDGTPTAGLTAIGQQAPNALFKVSDPATTAQFDAINAVTNTNIELAGGVTDAASNFASAAGVATTTLNDIEAQDPDASIRVTDGVSVAQFQTINLASTSDIELLGGVADNAIAFAALDGTVTVAFTAIALQEDDIPVIFKDAPTLAQYTAAKGATSGPITLNAGVEDTADLLASGGTSTAALNTLTDNIADVAISISDTPDVNELNAIAAKTTGVVTAAISASEENLDNLTTAATDAISMTVTDGVNVAEFIVLDALTSENISLASISDTADNLGADGSATVGFTAATTQDADVPVTITGTPTIVELNAIAAETTGVVTATISGSHDALAALSTAATDAITVTLTDEMSVAQFNTLDGKTGSNITLHANGVVDAVANFIQDDETAASGIAASDGLAAITVQDGDAKIQPTDAVTVAQFTILSAATTGTLELAGGVSDTAANLAANDELIEAEDDNAVFKISDAATVAQFVDIDAETTSAVVLEGGIKDELANILKADDTAQDGFTAAETQDPDVNVEITDTVTAADLNAIGNLTTGVVTASISGNEAALDDLASDKLPGTDAISITVTDDVTWAEFTYLDGRTALDIQVDGGIADTVANLVTNKTAIGQDADIAITISNAATAAQFDELDAVTSTNIVATGGITDAVANLVEADGTATAILNAISAQDPDVVLTFSDAINVSQLITANAATTANLVLNSVSGVAADFVDGNGNATAALLAIHAQDGNTPITITDGLTMAEYDVIDAATSGNISPTGGIRDTVEKLEAKAATINGQDGGTNVVFTVTDAATDAQFDTIAAQSTASVVLEGGVSDTAANLAAGAPTIEVDDPDAVYTFTDAATVLQVSTVDAKTTANMVFEAGISDSGDNLAASGVASDGLIAAANQDPDVAVTVTGTPSLLEINEIAEQTGGIVTAALSDSIEDLASLATGPADKITVTVSNAALVAQSTALDGKTAQDIIFGGGVADTAENLVAGASEIGAQDPNVIFKINDEATVADFNAIDAHSTGDIELPGGLRDAVSSFVADDDTATAGLTAIGAQDGDVVITITDPVTHAQFDAIDAKTSVDLVLEGGARDTAAELATVAPHIQGQDGDVVFTVTDAATDEQFDTIAAQSTASVVLEGGVTDTVTNLLAGAATIAADDPDVAFTINNAATVAQFNTIAALTTSSVVLQGGVTDTAANLAAGAATIGGHDPDVAFTISDAVSFEQFNAITAATTSDVVIAGGISGNIADFADENGAATSSFSSLVEQDDDVTLTIADELSIVEFIALNVATTGLIALTSGISDTAENLAPGGTVVAALTDAGTLDPDVAIEVIGGASVAQLNAIGNVTTGVVTASISGLAADLDDLGTHANDKISVTVTDSVTDAQFDAIDDNTVENIVLQGGVSDTAANLAAGASNIGAQDSDAVFTVTNAATDAQFDAIDAQTTASVVLEGGLTDTAVNLAAGAATIGAQDPDAVMTISDAATAAQFTAVDAGTTSNVVLAGGLTDTAANLSGVAASIGAQDPDAVYRFTDFATAAQFTAVDAQTTSSVVLSNGIEDTAANLVSVASAMGAQDTDVVITVTDSLTHAQFDVLDAQSTVSMVLEGGARDTAAELVLVAPTIKAQDNDVVFTVTDPATDAQFDLIAAESSAAVVLVGGVRDTAANLAAGAPTIEGDDPDALYTFTNAATVAQVEAVDADTTTNMVFEAGISDSADNLAASGVASDGLIAAAAQDTDAEVNVSDTPTLLELNKIAEISGGAVTATISGAIGDLASLATGPADKITVTVSDAALVAQFTSLNGKTAEDIIFSGKVADTAENLVASAATIGAHDADVVFKVTNAATVADFNAIDAHSTGAIELAGGVSDTAANLVAGAPTIETQDNNVIFTITDAATDAQFDLIAAESTASVVLAGGVTDTVANIVAGAPTIEGDDDDVDYTLTNAATVAQYNTIDGETLGDIIVGSGLVDTGDNFIASGATFNFATLYSKVASIQMTDAMTSNASMTGTDAQTVDGVSFTGNDTLILGDAVFTYTSSTGDDTIKLDDMNGTTTFSNTLTAGDKIQINWEGSPVSSGNINIMDSLGSASEDKDLFGVELLSFSDTVGDNTSSANIETLLNSFYDNTGVTNYADKVLVLASDGSDSSLWSLNNNGVDNVVTMAELELVANFTGQSDTSAIDDFIDYLY